MPGRWTTSPGPCIRRLSRRRQRLCAADAPGRLDYHPRLFHVRNPQTGEAETIGIADDDPRLSDPRAWQAGTGQSPGLSAIRGYPGEYVRHDPEQ